MLLAFKCPIGGVGAPMPILDSYTSSYNHIFIWNTKKNVEKISQYFIKKKIPFFGIGAPMQIFEHYISSYSHIFGQNASKLHFLYPTKLVEYEYVKKNVEKFPNIF